MFGVLECQTKTGEHLFLHAFSGQYEQQWLIDGWAPPLFDTALFKQLNTPGEAEIKKLTRELNRLPRLSDGWIALRQKRKSLSQALMREIFGLYEVHNFRGEKAGLRDAFCKDRIPTGTGDCCAPKLLNLAARSALIPLGMSEFFWGRENSSGTRQHGCFYPPCEEKCQPLLGFMLCGLEEIVVERERK